MVASLGEGCYQNGEEVRDGMTITDDDDGAGALGGGGAQSHCHQQWVTRGCDTHLVPPLITRNPTLLKRAFKSHIA